MRQFVSPISRGSILFVLLIIHKDYGPMRKAEQKACLGINFKKRYFGARKGYGVKLSLSGQEFLGSC